MTSRVGRPPTDNVLSRGLNFRQVPDPGNAGAISRSETGACQLVSAGAETRTLAAPLWEGQLLSLICQTYVGDIVVTVSAGVNAAANTVMTFGVHSDLIILIGLRVQGTLAWRVLLNDGVSLA